MVAKVPGNVTRTDVAREAGVSETTVSYVLSGSKDAKRISEATKRRIFAVAQRLGYSRSSTALALQRGYTDNIMLLIVTWELAMGHTRTTVAASQAAATLGLTLTTQVAKDDDEAASFLNRMQSGNPFGLLLLWDSASVPVDDIRRMSDRGLPTVDLLPSGWEGIASVTADREQGMGMMVRHLASMGHKRIGMIIDAPTRWTTSNRKLNGYRRALEDIGIGYDESLVTEAMHDHFEDGRKAFNALYSRRPDLTAVMSINDPVALGVISAAKDAGLRVPEDVSLGGFGAHPEGVYFRPKLTTLASPSERITTDAIEMLVKMRQEPDYKPESELYEMELIVRESTGPCPNTTK